MHNSNEMNIISTDNSIILFKLIKIINLISGQINSETCTKGKMNS